MPPTSSKGVSNLVDANGDLKLEVTANARFDLDLGIDLKEPQQPTPVVFDSTGLALDARVGVGNELYGLGRAAGAIY